jgi:hypothetical protein
MRDNMLFTDTIECDGVGLQINAVVYPEGGVCVDLSYKPEISIITREGQPAMTTWIYGRRSEGTHFAQLWPKVWDKVCRGEY